MTKFKKFSFSNPEFHLRFGIDREVSAAVAFYFHPQLHLLQESICKSMEAHSGLIPRLKTTHRIYRLTDTVTTLELIIATGHLKAEYQDLVTRLIAILLVSPFPPQIMLKGWQEILKFSILWGSCFSPASSDAGKSRKNC